jgi:small subunit ribosomal protein S7
MSRRHSAEKREINPDPKYGNLVVSKFMNVIMRAGKKSVAESIVYGALDLIEGKTKQNPVSVFEQALENVMPSIEVRSRRVGGATYQVPMQVNRIRQQSLSLRWIIGAARGKAGKPMFQRLADELMAAYRREGEAMAKRENTIKMADANKAFSHFAW